MTRLPSDSFLPSAALDSGHQQLHLSPADIVDSHSSSSVISPLSLPGAAHYFDPATTRPSVTSHPTNAYPHLNGASRDPPQAQPATFFSPHLTPIPSHAQRQLQFQRQPQQRSASLSPTRRSPSGRYATMEAKRPSDVDLSPRVTGAPRVSVPVDTISGTGSGVVTVRRPAATRTFSSETATLESHSLSLEAKMRQAWDNERRALQSNRDIAEEVYRETIEALRREHAQEYLQWEAERYSLQTQITQLQTRLREYEARSNEASLRGGGLDSWSTSGSFQRGSSQTSPTRQPGFPPPFHPREPLSMDAVADMDQEQPSKVIDVHEYHSDLEGINLKENAVKKATFTDTPPSSGSKPSSGDVSPPHLVEERRQTARERSLQAFKADERSRLTIHAGHTPTVSLSIVSTGVSNTVVSSGSNTPTLTGGDGALSDRNDNICESLEPVEPAPTGQFEDDLEPDIFEPSEEDPELKGPLTLRNIPAKDEIFLKKLADKLEKVGSGGEEATPTVLRHSDEEYDEDDEDEGDGAEPVAPDAAEGHTEGAKGVEGVEEHIPLKIKMTSNFGKPLGSL